MNTRTILTLAITSAFFLCSCMAEDSAVKTDFSLNEQEKAAEALVARVTGGHAEDFAVKITETRKDGRDWFSYYAGKNGKIVLEGNNGISVASALGDYLKDRCGWHLSWCGSDTALPDVLPVPCPGPPRTSTDIT